MPRPNWTYVKIDVLLPENDKWAGCPLGTQLVAEGVFARVLGYCHTAMTDGFVVASRWKQLGNAAGRRELLARGFLLEVDGGVEVPHYLDYYPSREKLERLSKDRREAGLRGVAERRRRKQLASGRQATWSAPPEAKPEDVLNRKGKGKGIYPSVPQSPLQVEGSKLLPPGGTADDDLDIPDPQDQELAASVQREVKLRTGGGHISLTAALALAEQLLGGRVVRNREAYLRGIIQREPRPRERFLTRDDPHPGGIGNLCSFCGQHGHGEDTCPAKAADDAAGDQPARRPTIPAAPADIARRGAALARELLAKAAPDAMIAPPETPVTEDGDELPF